MDFKGSRREFVTFLGGTALTAGVLRSGLALGSSRPAKYKPKLKHPLPASIEPSRLDQLVTAKGLDSRVLISFGEVINKKGDTFGFDNDFIAFVPLTASEALLWVNHEAPDPRFVSGYIAGGPRTRAQVDKEMKSVGGSIIKIDRDAKGVWAFNAGSQYNRRLDATTVIPFSGGHQIAGADKATGTLANCAGGTTPWGTVLSCEENYQDFYGERNLDLYQARSKDKAEASAYGWDKFYDHQPEHYGWVVEFDPKTGEARKHPALGRFAHEGATVVTAADGRPVVYMGDDAAGQCIYKFIGDKPGSLESGTLFAADLKAGRWQPLDLAKNPRLAPRFKNQTEVLIWTREAAKLAGGTPLDRPEDIAINPRTGSVIIALTNNIPAGNMYGSLLRITEKGGDCTALEFVHATLVSGGPSSAFACPDNLRFDRNGNLWMTTDMSDKLMGKAPYAEFANNGMFYIPLDGDEAGKPVQVVSGPIDSELTGPCFSDDYRTLFLSVQHPGATSKSLKELTSQWPHDGSGLPKPSVVTLSGPSLDRLFGVS